jgi:histidinol-phosphate aminotransferase
MTTVYQPGQSPTPGPGGLVFKLSANESPFGPLHSVIKVIDDAADGINRYPDNDAADLVAALSDHYQVPPEHIVTGCGAVGVLQQVFAAWRPAEAVCAWRTFDAYPLLASQVGCSLVPVPLVCDTHDLAAMAAAITRRTGLIIVCNPNNPTGTVVLRDKLEEFLRRVPPGMLVVLDEAYREYVRHPGSPDGIDIYRRWPNVALVRTFSKAYGLAGLRVGYLIAQEPVALRVRSCRLPFTVSGIAQAAAITSLQSEAELTVRASRVAAERERVRSALLAQHWAVPPTQANFVWLATGEDTPDFAAACERSGIAVRPYETDGVRVTIGDPEANNAFLAIARSYPRRH